MNKDTLIKQLMIDEGYVESVYNCSANKATFGIGHLITKADPEYGKPIGTYVSRQRCEDAFEDDLVNVLKDCYALFPEFDSYSDEEQEIIANMAFNLGRNRLGKFKRFIAAVKDRDLREAANQMIDSSWYRQLPNRAGRLVKRMKKQATTMV
jgi:lysozyme